MNSRTEYFDSISERWDGFSNLSALRAKLDARLDVLHLDGAATIVDLGCGTGNFSAFLLDHAPDLHTLHAVDFSTGMLDVARSKLHDPRVRFHREDAAHLSIQDGTVDLVICFSTWPHFPDPSAVLAEMHRILRPGGRLVILHVDSRETINDIHRGVGGLISQDMLAPAPELASFVTGNGFDVDAVADSEDGYLVSARKDDG
jgi:ubiquinone/menaquinone biosynthesis C-methylase UbiE